MRTKDKEKLLFDLKKRVEKLEKSRKRTSTKVKTTK